MCGCNSNIVSRYVRYTDSAWLFYGYQLWGLLSKQCLALLLLTAPGGRSSKSYLMLVFSLDCVHQDTSIFILVFQKNAGTGILVCR